MIRTIDDELHWIHESLPVDEGTYIHSSIYLLQDGDRTFMIDSGDTHNRDRLISQVEEVAQDGIDVIFLSKAHVPHSGNINAFKHQWPDAEVIFPGGAREIHNFPEVTVWPVDGTEERFGRTFDMTQAGVLKDVPNSTWFFDRGSRTLFTIDGFCQYHATSDANKLSSEFEDGMPYEMIHRFYEEMLLWLQFIDSPDRPIATLRETLDGFDYRYLAPGHGAPLRAEDVPEYLEHLSRAMEEISAAYQPPGLRS